MKKTAILGIDLQVDFTSPSGNLYVKGAEEDTQRIADFILKHQQKIDYIALTLDSHQPIHVAHQRYWVDNEGNNPPVFSTITAADVKNGKWHPQYNKWLATLYLEKLEAKGNVCTIWPMHCIQGTTGWAIDPTITTALSEWAITNNKSYELFYKGSAQSTEHYSIFRAVVEWESSPETKLNTKLLNILNAYNEIIIVGEAADYCVVSSLDDILEERPDMAKKITVLTDCMSWINPDNEKAKAIFEKAKKEGVRFDVSTNY